MNQFLKKVAVFGCILLGAAFLFQGVISYIIRDRSVFGTDILHLTDKVNADLLLMGSSRAWAHLDPKFFDTVFRVKTVNIGMNGHSELAIIRLRLENYLATNKPPKFAILNLDPFARTDSVNKTQNFVMKDQYARYAFFPTKANAPLVDYFNYSAMEKYVPLYANFKYRNLQYCLFPDDYNPYKKYGYWNSNENWDTIKHPVEPVMKKYFFAEKEMPKVRSQLQQIQKICTENNIKLLCLQTPAYQVTYDAVAFNRTRVICESL